MRKLVEKLVKKINRGRDGQTVRQTGTEENNNNNNITVEITAGKHIVRSHMQVVARL